MAHYIKNRNSRQGAIALQHDLDHEAQLPANCFSLDGMTGVREGFYLTLDERALDGRVRYPQLKVGHGFFRRNTRAELGCLYRVTKQGGYVRRAEIAMVTPREGKSYNVLNCPSKSRPNPLLFVRFGLGEGHVKLKDSVSNLGIWRGVCGSATLHYVSGGEALVQFKEGDQLCVMYPDGSVRLVVCAQGTLTLVPLDRIEMAKVRIHNAGQQLSECDQSELGKKRRTAILSGVIRLLELTRIHVDVREMIVEFLRTQELSGEMRAEIRARLINMGNQERALEFSDTTCALAGRVKRAGMPDDRRKKGAVSAAAIEALREKMCSFSGDGGKHKRN